MEQILFVLSFYGNLPHDQFIRRNGKLQTAGRILEGLRSRRPGSRRTHLQYARSLNPAVRHIARPARTLKRLINLLNEPSHFRNPATALRNTSEVVLRKVGEELNAVVSVQLHYLIVAAVNEIRSSGRLRAVLQEGPGACVAVEQDLVLRPKHLFFRGGHLGFKSPRFPIRILSKDTRQRFGGARQLYMLQGHTGPALRGRFVSTDGKPIDLTNETTLLRSMGTTRGRRAALTRRLRSLGTDLQWQRG